MTRDEAWDLLCEYTKSDSLRKHALAVEACVAAYARKLGEDETKWSVTALLHDFDYEIHPAAPDHPMKGEAILAARGVDEEIRRAILSHASYSGVSRETRLEKTLFACDELAGFLTAATYVKPTRSIHDGGLQAVSTEVQSHAQRATGQKRILHQTVLRLSDRNVKRSAFLEDAHHLFE